MGLGLFISKILLERTGSVIRFTNGHSRSNQKHLSCEGAQVEMSWIRTEIEVSPESTEGLIKTNPRNIN